MRIDGISSAYNASLSVTIVSDFPFGIVLSAFPHPIATKDRLSAVRTVVLHSTNVVNFDLSGQKWLDAPLSGRVGGSNSDWASDA